MLWPIYYYWRDKLNELEHDTDVVNELAAFYGKTPETIREEMRKGWIVETQAPVTTIRKRLAAKRAEVADRYNISLEAAAERVNQGTVMNPVSFGEVAASLAGQYKSTSDPIENMKAQGYTPEMIARAYEHGLWCQKCGAVYPRGYTHTCSGDKPMESFPSGAQRESQQLAYYDMPFEALDRVARIAHAGMQRYGERNWVKGIPQSNFFDHAIEHLRKWRTGDLSEDHLAKAAWNILALMHGESPKDQSPD